VSSFILFFGLVLVALLLFSLARWWFSADQRARRAMRALPVRPIAEALEAEKVRISGPARPLAEPLTAPLSGRPCACWRVVVEEKVRRDKTTYWRTVVDDHEVVDFVIEDGSGKAVVRTAMVQPVLDRDMDARSGFLNDATPELEAFLSERGHSSQGWVFNKTMRYREGVLEPGESVCVVGVGRWEPDPEAAAEARGYRTAHQPRRLVLSAPAEGPLLLSDEAGLQG